MSEKRLRKYVGDLLRPHGMVTQLESGATAAGVPDTVFYDKKTGRDYWIELKFCTPKKSFELRKTQIAWMRRRLKKGGEAFLLVKHEDKSCRIYILVRVDSVEKLTYLANNQSILHWTMKSEAEWGQSISDQQILEQLRATK